MYNLLRARRSLLSFSSCSMALINLPDTWTQPQQQKVYKAMIYHICAAEPYKFTATMLKSMFVQWPKPAPDLQTLIQELMLLYGTVDLHSVIG